jgi:hypothetical protein
MKKPGKKKPPWLAVFWIFAGSRRCYVNLPLLHRLGVGMAKIKMAGKKNGAVHGAIQKVWNDYNNNRRALARSLSAVFTLSWLINNKNPPTC